MKKSWLFLLTVLLLALSTSSAFGLQFIHNGGFEAGPFGVGPIPWWHRAGKYPAAIVPNVFAGKPELGTKVAFLASPLQGACVLFHTPFYIPAAMSDVYVDFQYMPISESGHPGDFVSIFMLYDAGGGPQTREFVHWFGTGTPWWQTFHRHYDISAINNEIFCIMTLGTFATVCGSTGLFVDNVSVEAVPEPATLLLLGGGLVGMGAIGAFRRRKK